MELERVGKPAHDESRLDHEDHADEGAEGDHFIHRTHPLLEQEMRHEGAHDSFRVEQDFVGREGNELDRREVEPHRESFENIAD